jgi:predicted RNA-binding Zn-ribbon protein involved in translation (DUF1610 family)
MKKAKPTKERRRLKDRRRQEPPSVQKRKRDLTPLTSMPSRLECPRCGSGLRQLLAGISGQMYICMKCGYSGPIGLEPGKVRLGKLKRI